MKFKRVVGYGWTLKAPLAFGDCRCGHSVAYHLPLAGCLKCGCDEFR